MQREITTPGPLHDEEGRLLQRGWARRPLLEYDRTRLKVGWHRIKEWDYYGIFDKQKGFTFFVADLGYFALATINVLDFVKGTIKSKGGLKLFTRGRLGLSPSSLEGGIEFKGGCGTIKLERHPWEHVIALESPKLGGLKGTVSLGIDPSKDSMVVSTGYPEDKPNCFYYNHKWNLLPVRGCIEHAGVEHVFDGDLSKGFGGFDWGRGVWPYKSRWLWGTGAGIVDGHEVWFNIGYGFGDLSTHTENMVFYDGKVHKLDQVTFHPSRERSGEPWRFTSNDDRLSLVLTPLVDASTSLNLGFLMTHNNQVHGTFSGTLVLDDGTRLDIHDELHGHAEHIFYRW